MRAGLLLFQNSLGHTLASSLHPEQGPRRRDASGTAAAAAAALGIRGLVMGKVPDRGGRPTEGRKQQPPGPVFARRAEEEAAAHGAPNHLL